MAVARIFMLSLDVFMFVLSLFVVFLTDAAFWAMIRRDAERDAVDRDAREML